MSNDVTQHLQAFDRLEARCRAFLSASLIAAHNQTPVTLEHAGTRHLIDEIVLAIGTSNKARFQFDFEEAIPVSDALRPYGFFEALPRLIDEDGHKLMPGDIFPALGKLKQISTSPVGPALRLWIMAAQIKQFYEGNPPSARISLNVVPFDTDYGFYRDIMTDIIAHADKCGYHVVLEALECGPWPAERLGFLKGLQAHGITLAVDDYGGRSGNHTPQTLANFAAATAQGRDLIVKIDGHLIRDYVDRGDQTLLTRLAEIRSNAPEAKIVAEWVKSPEETSFLLKKLAENGLSEALHMVQSRDLCDSCDAFLKKIAGRQDKPQSPAP